MTGDLMLIDGLCGILRALVENSPPAPERRYQTPIERYFYLSFIWGLKFMDRDGDCEVIFGDTKPKGLPLQIYPQWDFHGWRVDYLILMTGKDGKRKCVVECDGHDFHERTKEQARRDRARDRQLQEEGITIFRFTGSELFREPVECALQVYLWLYNIRRYGVQ